MKTENQMGIKNQVRSLQDLNITFGSFVQNEQQQNTLEKRGYFSIECQKLCIMQKEARKLIFS